MPEMRLRKQRMHVIASDLISFTFTIELIIIFSKDISGQRHNDHGMSYFFFYFFFHNAIVDL